MKGIGLVFAGGGGKGAYEIGVWKYLHEIGIDSYVTVVSGTSVGALNAALFVGSSYESAEKLWLNIDQKKILTPEKISKKEIVAWIIGNSLILSNPISVIGSVLSPSKIPRMIAEFLLISYRRNHFFSREGLLKLIREGVDFERLQNSKIPCYVTCVKCPRLSVERFHINDYQNDDIITLLLASSAMPVVFPNETFQGRRYCDGGIPIVGDNVPIKPVYDTKVENIIVVQLNNDITIDRDQFPNARIIEIVPSKDLGDVIKGTLDFSPEGVLRRLKLGYEDAKKILEPFVNSSKWATKLGRISCKKRA